jgi:hypothetical protein
MGEPAVSAPDGKMPAAYCYIMGTSYVTVSAFRGFNKVPDIITHNRCECPWLSDIFNTGDKDTGHAAIFTRYLCLVGYCFYDLVCHLLAMVAVSAEFCKNKPVAHGKYWICPGSLICCTTTSSLNLLASGMMKSDPLTFITPVMFTPTSNIIPENLFSL